MNNNDNNPQFILAVSRRKTVLLEIMRQVIESGLEGIARRLQNLGHTEGTSEYAKAEERIMTEVRVTYMNNPVYLNSRTARQVYQLSDCVEEDMDFKAEQYAEDFVSLTSPNSVLGNASLSDEEYERQPGTRTIVE